MQHLLLLQFRIRIFLCTHVYVLTRLTINLFTLISVVRQGQLLRSRLDSWRKLGVGRRELKLGSVRILYQRNPTICRFTTIFIFTVPTPLCGFCYFLYYEYECCCCEFLFISEDLSLRPILASLPFVLVLEIYYFAQTAQKHRMKRDATVAIWVLEWTRTCCLEYQPRSPVDEKRKILAAETQPHKKTSPDKRISRRVVSSLPKLSNDST
jgi:hypothetical protein